MAAAGAQHLLGRPQRIAPSRRPYDSEMGEIDACGRQRGRVRHVRRRKPHDPLSGPGERGERGQDKLQLADTFAVAEDLGQRAGRPAAAGKLAVEVHKARGDRGCRDGQRAAAPDRMPLQDFFECRH